MSPAVASALAAIAAYPALPAVPSVTYRSAGRLLVICQGPELPPVLSELRDPLRVSVLCLRELPASMPAGVDVFRGELLSLAGWLGEFSAVWSTGSGSFDLVLNLTTHRCFDMHQPPQGYFAPGDDPLALTRAVEELLDGVGEFEKPKFFSYNAKTCAHSRSSLPGCDRCIAVCSTRAIEADGDHVRVEPHLCMGCGACATVCPSGAMQYNYPAMSYWGGKLQAVLAASRQSGGEAPWLLLHNPSDLRNLDLRALPDQVIPLETYHVAAIGLDWMLGAVAYGAARVLVLTAGSEAPQYLEALRQQIAIATDILRGLGYGEGHLVLVAPAELTEAMAPCRLPLPAEPAAFRWFDDKRTTLQFAIEHLMRHAPPPIPETIALPAGAPFGSVNVDRGRCTLCYSCVSTCPASALRDGAGEPQLRFVESNCLQCGLCEAACPERAITLQPRLLTGEAAKQARVLHQDQPFCCVRCGKPFATTHMIGAMLHKLSGHSMFSTPEARRRLQMCGDCRVIDLMSDAPEARK